jgi:hypothetical protein
MDKNSPTWQDRFELTTCAANAVASVIPEKALGVAVIYQAGEAGEKVFLVIDSRAKSLRAECERRLATAKLPPLETLSVSFREEPVADDSREALNAACREQVILASILRRELRPALR